MTRFVTFLMLTVIFLITVAMAVVLFVKISTIEPTIPPVSYDPNTSVTKPVPGFLSKLSLLPSGKKKVQPVAVMIENHEDARPFHEGLDDALMVQEFLVEGQISRFAVIFNLKDLPKRVGPVRSLRSYFIDSLLPQVQTIFHAGGSPDALQRVREDGRFTAFNGLGYPNHFLRDDEARPPHNLFLPKVKLLDLLEEKPAKVQWPPYRIGSVRAGSGASVIRVNFFNTAHNVKFNYNIFGGMYDRINGGEKSKAHPRNVLILEMPILDVREYGRLTINVSGRGKLILFRSGFIQEGEWSKGGPDHPYVFTDENGEELRFSKGQTWMMVLPTLSRVSWDEEE